jgi:hypothetical protein
VAEFRDSDRMFSVELFDWKLANGKSPTLYGQQSSLSLKPFAHAGSHTDSVDGLTEKSNSEKSLDKALKLKEEAGELFRAKNYEGAKDKYLESLRSMEYMAEEYSNEQKALAFELTVPCHNNLALCCIHCASYAEAAVYANNVSSLHRCYLSFDGLSIYFTFVAYVYPVVVFLMMMKCVTLNRHCCSSTLWRPKWTTVWYGKSCARGV